MLKFSINIGNIYAKFDGFTQNHIETDLNTSSKTFKTTIYQYILPRLNTSEQIGEILLKLETL